MSHPNVYACLVCAALQQNREQVTQAYFEVWAIEAGIHIEVKNNSSVNFEIFLYIPYMFSITFM